MAELKHEAPDFEKSGIIEAFDDGICKSDTVIPSSLKSALRKAVAPLEQVPPLQKDWHPGSGEKVLDLVHPSLFPLIYGRSRILPTETMTLETCIQQIGKGEIIPEPMVTDPATLARGYRASAWTVNPWSKKFQWLPCDVAFTEDDDEVR